MEELFDYQFIEEKMKRAGEVFMNRYSGTMYFEDPDDDNRMFMGEGKEPWGTTDPLLFAIKLDDYEIYKTLTPEEAIKLINELGEE